jgi:hypothetical protein
VKNLAESTVVDAIRPLQGHDGLMQLIALAAASSGGVLATFRSDDREITTVFTTNEAHGITVASPEPDVFTSGGFSVDAVRRIVTAVIAFERACSDA